MKAKHKVVLLIVCLLTISGAVIADDLVMFSYQGRVKVQGNPYDGTGYFKFAIVNQSGTVSLWSNDGTSVGGSEPAASVTATVTNGIYSVMIGDPSLGMQPINSVIFNSPGVVKLRVWFSDGTHGFEQLTPDCPIANPRLIGILSGTQDFTVYVNGTTGNDDNNGLTTDTAKRTIQAAVNMIPPRVRCNITVQIADGVYRENVRVHQISVEYGKSLTFMGDENWNRFSPGDPSVRITGTDNDTSPTKVRSNPFMVYGCTYVKVQGILFDYANESGMLVLLGGCYVHNCKFAHNDLNGLHIADGAYPNIENCLAEYNGQYGIRVYNNSYVNIRDVISRNNTVAGMLFYQSCSGYFNGTCEFSNNGQSGLLVKGFSRLFFDSYTGQISNNGSYGIDIVYDAHTQDHTKNTFSGNPGGDVHTANGGHAY